MFEIKEEFKGNYRDIIIDVGVKVIKINTRDNSKMLFEDFELLNKEGFGFIFDLSRRIKKEKDMRKFL